MPKWSGTSTLLTCIGAVGVVVTAVLTAKAAPKAEKMLTKAELESETELTTFEKVKTVAPAYIPAAIAGVSTIGCIFGANVLNKRSQAALASAYALLDSSYKEYRKKVEEVYGEDANTKVIEEFIDEVEETDEEQELLFFDYNTLQYFTTKVEKSVMEDGMECYIISTPPEFAEKIWAQSPCYQFN